MGRRPLRSLEGRLLVDVPAVRPASRRRGEWWVLVVAMLTLLVGTAQPSAATEDAVDVPWVATSPTVFGLGDSLFMQCGETLGLGERSSGMVGWPGATSTDLRARMSSTVADWPFMTEGSHTEELADFRGAGTWVIGLGTNDVRKITPGEYRGNVDWFLRQSEGRPVLWFTVHHPQYELQAATLNGILADAARQWPNLRLLDWGGYVADHPEALARDGVHIASYQACRQGRFDLIRAQAPAVRGQDWSPSWEDPAPQPPPTPDPVTAEHEATGGPLGPLGEATGDLGCGRRGDGCAQWFTAGAIAWSPETGAHALPAPVAAVWREYGETGGSGYPVGDAVCGLAAGGCRQKFESGWVYWSPRTAAFQVTGPVLTTYLARGAEGGSLGYPTTGLPCGLVRVGCVQHFTGGSIFWSATTGARMVTGAVRARHRAAGAENGRLGYPTIDTACNRSGCGQHFTGGSVYWSATTGARIVSGGVRDRWLAAGAAGGTLGYPTIDTACNRSGCGQHFTGGSVYSSSRTGTHLITGAIRTRWLALGGVRSRLGYPTSDPQAVPGGSTQRFEGGTLTYRNGRWA